MKIALPLIYAFSAKVQLLILAAIFAASYLHRRARIGFGILATLYLAFKMIVPLFQWGFWLFKGVAMFGFYIHYFQIGVGFIITGFAFVFNDGIEMLLKELEKRERTD